MYYKKETESFGRDATSTLRIQAIIKNSSNYVLVDSVHDVTSQKLYPNHNR